MGDERWVGTWTGPKTYLFGLVGSRLWFHFMVSTTLAAFKFLSSYIITTWYILKRGNFKSYFTFWSLIVIRSKFINSL
jgi:hypothetical protein